MRTDRLNDLGWNLWRAALLVPVGYVAFVLLTTIVSLWLGLVGTVIASLPDGPVKLALTAIFFWWA